MDFPITIAVDAMGSDNAPYAEVEGAAIALENDKNIHILLIGQEKAINSEMVKYGNSGRIKVINADEVIGPHETPTTAIKKKKGSSMVMALNAVKDGGAHAIVSAGNTGALLTGATLIIGRSEGIERPALGTLIPTRSGHTLLIDSGANMDAKPSYLVQFADIGSDYVKKMMGIDKPKVALINVGAEKEKGNTLAKETYPLLETAPGINFIGNIEAREIPMQAADVVVCDAFVGNIVLKYTEGLAKALMEIIKDELTSGFVSKCGALLAKPGFKRIKKRFDYREIGGAPFLGLKSLVVKAHGSSDALAISNAIKQCSLFLNKQ